MSDASHLMRKIDFSPIASSFHCACGTHVTGNSWAEVKAKLAEVHPKDCPATASMNVRVEPNTYETNEQSMKKIKVPDRSIILIPVQIGTLEVAKSFFDDELWRYRVTAKEGDKVFARSLNDLPDAIWTATEFVYQILPSE